MWNSDETTEIVRQKVLFPKDKRLCLCAERPAQSWKIDLLTKPFSTWILFRFHLSNRYYHQDLHWWYRSGRSHPKMIASLPLRTITTSLLLKKDNEKNKEFSISFLFLVSTNRKKQLRLSGIHYRGTSIRRVSCYTLLGRWQLPWPQSSCLDWSTLFGGSVSERHAGRTRSTVDPALPDLLTRRGPLGHRSIRRSLRSAAIKWQFWTRDIAQIGSVIAVEGRDAPTYCSQSLYLQRNCWFESGWWPAILWDISEETSY